MLFRSIRSSHLSLVIVHNDVGLACVREKPHEQVGPISSKDAKKVYTNCTAAVLRAKDSVMKTASTVQENAEDILAEAKQINEERAAKEAALEQEAEEVTEETVADNTDFAEEA